MLDALSRGTPVICTDAGGVPEGVRDAHTGYIVPCNDADAVRDAMLRVAGWSAEERERCRRVSAELWDARFSSAMVTQKWRDFDLRMRAA
jgi:glycosyltransferase involved in cell wall biosynthesis